MKRTVYTDPFFYNQPELTLVDELKEPMYKEKPEYYGKRTAENGEKFCPRPRPLRCHDQQCGARRY